jgi:aromatic acid exporter family member 1
MTLPRFSSRKLNQLGATARTVAQRAPETLTFVRYRAQPTAATIVRLATTAIVAYMLALLLTVTSRPVLGPLTALLVAQVTRYQTVRNAVPRVVSVLAGVLVAVAFSALIGFTW